LEPITHVAVHPEGYRLGDWLVLHDAPVDDPRPIVHGHLHPYLRKAGLEGEAPCFLHHPSRLVLPPWCKHAAGGNVLGMHDWRSADCSAILDGRVVALGPLARLRRLLPGKPKSYRIGIGLTQ
jgi:metallophosphoesterase superfamily enzyme